MKTSSMQTDGTIAHGGKACSKERKRESCAHLDRPAGAVHGRQVTGAGPVVFTIGHSTRSGEDFVALLAAHGVERLVDVRTVPRSRHNPQFNRDTLPQALQAAGIEYVHMAGLGGLRKPQPDSANAGWRNLSFRGYADHMQTAEFSQSLVELMAAAHKQQLALMCAEAVPWRCHRSLIGDALLVHGVPVEEIVDAKRREPHRLTPFAVVDGTTITYPQADSAKPRQTELFAPAPRSPRRRRSS
jgi:hypothetical protein